MAKQTKQQLIKENQRLRSELASAKSADRRARSHLLKSSVKWLVFGLACAILIVANLTFYIARTLVETDKFMAVASPLIRQPAVQDAIADKTTNAIYAQVDAEQLISTALPEQLAPLAPALSGQLQKFTYDKSKEILATESFQNVYDEVVEKTHRTFIEAVKNYQGDGTVSVSDIYARLSARLQDSKLSFLAGKQLPESIGSIQVLQADWLPTAHSVVTNLNNIRAATAGLFFALIGLFLWLSKNRRRAVIQLSLAVVLLGTATILALNVAGSLFVSQAKNYPAAAEAVWSIFSAPLIQQTVGGIALAAAIGLVAWLGGSTKTALTIKRRGNDLVAGRLHKSLFPKENNLTRWFGRYKKYLHAAVGVGFILSVALVNISWASFIGLGLCFFAACRFSGTTVG